MNGLIDELRGLKLDEMMNLVNDRDWWINVIKRGWLGMNNSKGMKCVVEWYEVDEWFI